MSSFVSRSNMKLLYLVVYRMHWSRMSVVSLLHAFVNVFEPIIPSGILILVIEQLIAIRKPTRDSRKLQVSFCPVSKGLVLSKSKSNLIFKNISSKITRRIVISDGNGSSIEAQLADC